MTQTRANTGRASQRRPRVVLVGAGHAHLHTLQHAHQFTARGFDLVLVAPDAFWYSGLATGMLGGEYPPEFDQVNVAALVERGGGRFVRDSVRGVAVAERRVHRAAGPPLDYDVLSINLGSEVPAGGVPGLAEHAVLVKPIRNLWSLRQALEDRFHASPTEPVRVVIAGGGPTACELAANIHRLAACRRGSAEVTLLVAGDRVVASLPERAGRLVAQSLGKRGVQMRWRAEVVQVNAQEARLADGGRVQFDVLVAAIGLRPSPLVKATGLPCDAEGALLVDDHLRSVADPHVFGGGDCVAVQGRKLARIGVYAVRESPILCRNLLATLQGRPLARFRPQRRFLLILNLGDGTGLATWGPLWWHGRAAFWLKDRIDRRFLARYQRGLPPPG